MPLDTISPLDPPKCILTSRNLWLTTPPWYTRRRARCAPRNPQARSFGLPDTSLRAYGSPLFRCHFARCDGASGTDLSAIADDSRFPQSCAGAVALLERPARTRRRRDLGGWDGLAF